MREESTGAADVMVDRGLPLTGELPEIVIRPSRGWRRLDLRELWAYRELIHFLTWRELKVRYKHTVLGADGNG